MSQRRLAIESDAGRALVAYRFNGLNVPFDKVGDGTLPVKKRWFDGASHTSITPQHLFPRKLTGSRHEISVPESYRINEFWHSWEREVTVAEAGRTATVPVVSKSVVC